MTTHCQVKESHELGKVIKNDIPVTSENTVLRKATR